LARKKYEPGRIAPKIGQAPRLTHEKDNCPSRRTCKSAAGKLGTITRQRGWRREWKLKGRKKGKGTLRCKCQCEGEVEIRDNEVWGSFRGRSVGHRVTFPTRQGGENDKQSQSQKRGHTRFKDHGTKSHAPERRGGVC